MCVSARHEVETQNKQRSEMKTRSSRRSRLQRPRLRDLYYFSPRTRIVRFVESRAQASAASDWQRAAVFEACETTTAGTDSLRGHLQGPSLVSSRGRHGRSSSWRPMVVPPVRSFCRALLCIFTEIVWREVGRSGRRRCCRVAGKERQCVSLRLCNYWLAAAQRDGVARSV